MYVHSYQSLVWNRVVTHRIREYGLSPIPGDLVPGNGNVPQTITEETLPMYTINDVVLPLPGYDIVLPSNGGVYVSQRVCVLNPQEPSLMYVLVLNPQEPSLVYVLVLNPQEPSLVYVLVLNPQEPSLMYVLVLNPQEPSLMYVLVLNPQEPSLVYVLVLNPQEPSLMYVLVLNPQEPSLSMFWC